MDSNERLLQMIQAATAKLRRAETELALAKARLDETMEAENVATLKRQIKLAKLELEDALTEVVGYGQSPLIMNLAGTEVEINERSAPRTG